MTLNLALVGEETIRVRDLTGFRKSHRVPDEITDRAQSFIRRIATPELEADLDKRFADFRRCLGLKRVEMDVDEPLDGVASIATPSFAYRVSVRLADDDPSTAVCERCVDRFSDPQPLMSPDFSAAFGNTFNSVRMLPPEPLEVERFIDWIECQDDAQLTADYDRTATWCRLLFSDSPAASMLVRSDSVSLTALEAVSPAVLLKSFVELRERLPEVAGGDAA